MHADPSQDAVLFVTQVGLTGTDVIARAKTDPSPGRLANHACSEDFADH